MCGIWALFGLDVKSMNCIYEHFFRICHRGPDAYRFEFDNRLKNSYLAFHRLTIVDYLPFATGMQPMRLGKYPHLFLLCNGEIYNYHKIEEQYGFHNETKCDVEVILHLYDQGGINKVAQSLDGVFAFCLVDIKQKKILVGRDPYGVRPLFKLHSKNGLLAVCSESKGIIGLSKYIQDEYTLKPFLPGHYEEYTILNDGRAKLLQTINYHKPGDRPTYAVAIPWNTLSNNDVPGNIRKLLSSAVEKRLMANRRIGCLLSGGLDSSLIAALLVQHAKKHELPYEIQSFAIGTEDSPDIIAARQVAKYIGTDHHEVLLGPKEVAEVLDKVIYHLETFDITTIRASIAVQQTEQHTGWKLKEVTYDGTVIPVRPILPAFLMYIISRYIRECTDTTVIFSGEGADELAQGYIYFRDAPTALEAHHESIRLLQDIYLFDALRADRTTSAFGLELRVPFLDIQFTNYYLSLDACVRQPQDGIEKHLLRSAFNETDILPPKILWRHKEAFSDGVTSMKKSLIQIIQDIVEEKVQDEDLAMAHVKYPHCTPKTKEALYYRNVFESHYGGQAEIFTPYFWMPRWVNGIVDPSARFIKHYSADMTI